MDDLFGHDASETDHLEHLKRIFQKVREAGLTLNLSKCGFFKRHLLYLGYLISVEGIFPSKEKIEMILDLASPYTCN